MPWTIEYVYVAGKPFRAEHPLGSGTIVSYQPGDEVPASDWGRATDNMLEMGKLFRTAKNVWVDDDGEASVGGGEEGASALSEGAPSEAEAPAEVTDETVSYPVKKGGGYWLLSDGSKVRGKPAASAAQAELDTAAGE